MLRKLIANTCVCHMLGSKHCVFRALPASLYSTESQTASTIGSVIDLQSASCRSMWHHQLTQNHASLLQHLGTLRVHGIVEVVHDLLDACLNNLDGATKTWTSVRFRQYPAWTQKIGSLTCCSIESHLRQLAPFRLRAMRSPRRANTSIH